MQGEEAVIVILSGTEQLADIVNSASQVRRRFSRLTLPQVSATLDGDAFLDLIDNYCGTADLGPRVSHELIDRLFHSRP